MKNKDRFWSTQERKAVAEACNFHASVLFYDVLQSMYFVVKNSLNPHPERDDDGY